MKIIYFIAIVLILSVLGFYFWQNIIKPNQIYSSFEEAINRKDFDAVKNLMAEKVDFTVEASDNCGIFEKERAANDLQNYISGCQSFNFSQDQDIVLKLKEDRPDVFDKIKIGIADNKVLLAYKINREGEIDYILLAASYEMYK